MNESIAESKSGVTYKETPEEITVRIRGTMKANLDKIAAVMNGVGWCDTDNTAVSVLDGFIIGYWLRQLEDKAGLIEATTIISDGIDTGFELDTKGDKARREEISRALSAWLDGYGKL